MDNSIHFLNIELQDDYVLMKLCLFYSMNAPVMVELEGETDPLEVILSLLRFFS